MVIPKTRNGNGTFRTENYFKLKHGTEQTNQCLYLCVRKKI